MVITRRLFAAGAVSVLAGSALAPAALAGGRFGWPSGARAAVSLTYDDGLDSQADNVAPALDAAGFKGTFFLTRDNMQARVADWQAVHRAGHEVGNHSVTHPCKLGRCTSAEFRHDEIAPMEAFLNEAFGADRFRSYAYPCGFIGLGRGGLHQRIARYEIALKGEVQAARTVSGLANDPLRVAGDPYMLHAYEPTYDVDDPRLAYRYVRRTMATGGWAILVFHEVLPRRMGEGDTSLAAHAEILQWLSQEPVWCAPMGEVFRYCAERAPGASPSMARRQPEFKARARA